MNVKERETGAGIFWAVAFTLLLMAFNGLFMVHPNQGVVLQLFGRYMGTVRKPDCTS